MPPRRGRFTVANPCRVGGPTHFNDDATSNRASTRMGEREHDGLIAELVRQREWKRATSRSSTADHGGDE
jgi:hypothetical protein